MSTFLDALESSLRQAAAHNRYGQEAPAAVLWTDGEKQWPPLLPLLRERLPILTLGGYDPENRTGPAIWIRCMLSRTLPEADWPEEAVPVVYLPGVSRAELRAVEECPKELKPLAELQYRGVLWTQKNAKDWTLAAFLQSSDGGLGTPVTGDQATRQSLACALAELAHEDVENLRKQAPLKASFFDSLVNPDPPRNLLLWMCNPEGTRQAMSRQQWTAFVSTCKSQYAFDPEGDGELRAAELLADGKGAWGEVWQRFVDSPHRFSGLRDLLDRAQPAQLPLIVAGASVWPRSNRQREEELRKALCALKTRSTQEARETLRSLEREHGGRRECVWAALGDAPLAFALKHLTALADASEAPLSGANPEQMADKYAEKGWQVDDAMLKALAEVQSPADLEPVKAISDSVYRPWLRDVAEEFQKLVSQDGLEHPDPAASLDDPPACVCILFSDALRFDLARRLRSELEAEGLEVELGWSMASLPTVTATAKAGISPVAPLLQAGPEFSPSVESGTKVDIAVLRRLLSDHGYDILLEEDVGDPSKSAWTESGRLDALGHLEGWKLAHRVEEELRSLTSRVKNLVQAGWKEIGIVTDHGWLLLPTGLPKQDLPEHLTEVRKGRCARMKAGSETDLMTVPWRWDPTVAIAVAPGISCFVAGKEYEHGGVSLQECVVPRMSVKGTASQSVDVTIAEVRWQGLRCRVSLRGDYANLSVDLRKKEADASTSMVDQTKTAGEDGRVSLVVPDDKLTGEGAVLVLLGTGGEVVKKQGTVVGGEKNG